MDGDTNSYSEPPGAFPANTSWRGGAYQTALGERGADAHALCAARIPARRESSRPAGTQGPISGLMCLTMREHKIGRLPAPPRHLQPRDPGSYLDLARLATCVRRLPFSSFLFETQDDAGF